MAATYDADLAIRKIMEILLALDDAERAEVWSAVTHNDTFCVHCGIGEVTSPNARCQCTNDE